jgi:predicted AAA+ superfamily ATPase
MAGDGKTGALLVLDEIQKITDWPNVVKLHWDADTHSGVALKVVLLVSAPLLIQSSLAESLAGRFEAIAVPHWSYTEMREAFGWNLEHYIFYGAYPGAAGLIEEPERWRRYILDSLIETTISRDILSLTRVDKPALLRRLFLLGCAYSGQILSYQKMIGQLADAGNTTTLAHYLELLQGAGMLAGLPKYSSGQARQRGSSPKTQALNTALMSAQDHRAMEELERMAMPGGGWSNPALARTCLIPALEPASAFPIGASEIAKWILFCSRARQRLRLK